MIRVAFFLILVGAASFGVAWLADRPGEVVVTWQGWRLETSLLVLGAAVLAVMALIALLWSILRAVLRSPFALRSLLHHRRGARAYEAISRGLIAVAAGDVVAARKLTAETNRIAPAEPLALLLGAQAAQLAGDRIAAERAFRTMAGRADTKALGLHGLFIEAQRRDDGASARAYAEEAARMTPTPIWAGKAVLEFRCATGDWAGALALLERNRSALDKLSYRRQRAVLLTARAIAAQETDRDNAKAFALEATKLAPSLVPAAALAARFLAEGGEMRRATRLLDRAWRAHPHPELARAFSELRLGDAARDRLRRMENVAKKVPGHIEGLLALARAALEAQEFSRARAALAPCLDVPTRRVCLLMAEIERAETNDEGRAREWMARALNAAPDPAWTADNYVSNRWLPVSPVSGRLDAFEWRVPLTGMVSESVVIESEPPPALAPAATASEPPKSEHPNAPEAAPQNDEAEHTSASSGSAAAPAVKRASRPMHKAEPIIPLVHAPDDPGPGVIAESDPRDAPQGSGWRTMFK